MNQNEIWKQIKGYEGLYEVSNFGRVKSLDRYVNRFTKNRERRIIHIKEKILKQHTNTAGYYTVVLTKESISKWVRVHRLIADAFIPNPHNLSEVDHINTDKKDNRIENLRWCTHKENMNNPITRVFVYDVTQSELAKEKRFNTHIIHKTTTAPQKVFQYTLEGVFMKEYRSVVSASNSVGVTSSAIRLVLDKENRKSANFMWRTYKAQSIKPYINPKKLKGRKIVRLNEFGEIIGEWKSIKEASKDLGIYSSTIHRNMYPNYSKNYRFAYK